MDLAKIKGIGPKKQQLLAQLDIHDARDLLLHYPRRYEDRTSLRLLRDLLPEEVNTLRATIVNVTEQRSHSGLHLIKVVLKDESGMAVALWFNQPYVKAKLVPGTVILLTGRVRRNYGNIEITVQDYEFWEDGGEQEAGRILAVYPAIAGLPQKLFRQAVAQVLAGGFHLPEFLPETLRRQYDLPERMAALSAVHCPKDWASLEEARHRLVFEEFFLLQLSLVMIRQKGSQAPGIAQKQYGHLTDAWLSALPFALTGAQKRVIEEIHGDMAKPYAMSRLVQGDVGSGKTAVAAWALLVAAENGNQGALMAPTEILAQQHYDNLLAWFAPLGVTVGFFKGGQPQKERQNLLEALQAGKIQIAVGTHALFQESVQFQQLGLIVIDEQHRFGVRQRARLQEKGDHPDLLVMSATPIPRTLALTLYGDLDISLLDEMPPGRKPVQTICILEKAREKLYMLLLKEIQEGNQAFVVCPLIEESEVIDLQNATEIYGQLSRRLRPYAVGLLHGRQSGGEKEEIMASFSQGRLQVLVATTVVEVGVNVPRATMMVVENSERFGLAQLHQLRGRVGRGERQAYCILVTNTREPVALQRLKLMTETNDGFRLAEEDMLLRGPGEFFGTRQHGLPEFRLARLPEDRKVLEEARNAALTLLGQDPALAWPAHQALKEMLMQNLAEMTNG